MAVTIRPASKSRVPGMTVCTGCRDIVDNSTMVEVVRLGRQRGKWVCALCGERAGRLR